MEMQKVPQAGYAIEGLWIAGITTKTNICKRMMFPLKLSSLEI
jgi:UDP-N-acetylglucosamine--N-acetylmuramyl-(pentapeptide) pyrophosphoryl-undecaprenol N-acetylglucosamine transferase